METNQSTLSPEEGSVYQGKIVDQTYVTSGDETRVILTVKITARLNNDKDVADGAEECPHVEREVWITFGSEDDWKFERSINDLARLGFTEDDISRLHPDHPEFFSLVSKDVYVRFKTSGNFDYWNLAWPRVKSQSVSLDQAKKTAAPLQSRIAQTRKKMKEERASKKKSSNTTPGGEEKPDVAY